VNKSPADAHDPYGWHHERWVSIARRISSYAYDDRRP
jgi:hypothetical protein